MLNEKYKFMMDSQFTIYLTKMFPTLRVRRLFDIESVKENDSGQMVSRYSLNGEKS